MASDIVMARASLDVVPTLEVQRIGAGPGHADQPSWFRRAGRLVLFLSVVVLPTVCAATYFTFIAADQYASETRFLVRSPQRASAGLISGFLQSTGFVRAQDDSYAITDFIKSRDAVVRLVEKGPSPRGVRPAGGRHAVARFPGPFWSGTIRLEALFRYYLGFIKVQTDNASGISTLEVRAFRPDDARNIAMALLDEAEAARQPVELIGPDARRHVFAAQR